jgi:hypothetical protein
MVIASAYRHWKEREIPLRYRKGHISVSDTKDVPLLLTIRNARAITYDQICSLAHIDGIAANKRIAHWRLSRLEQSGLVQRIKHDLLFSQPVFSITASGLEVLESRGHSVLSLPSTTGKIVRRTQILHSVELAGIRQSLASKGILKSWKWELEIVSRNLVYEGESTKDYDALAEIVVGNVTKTLGIEFERTLKGAGRYENLRRVINAERSVDTILYLAPNSEILYLLAVELRDVRKRIGFALSKSFQADLLDADILSNSSAGEVISFREFLLS